MSESSVGRSSALMAAGTVISRVLGFAKAIVLVSAVGVTSSAAADAFQIGNQLPNNVYVLLIGGALNAILVPQLVRAGVHTENGQVYLNRLLTLSLVLLGGITILATVAAPLLVPIYAGTAEPAILSLAIGFAYWCLPQIFFYGVFTILGEVLNSRSYYGPYMWAPVINNVVSIAGLVVFIQIFGQVTGVQGWTLPMVLLLAGTATLGVIAQALFLVFFWRRAGLGFALDFHWRGVGLGAVGKAAGWTFSMLVVMQLGGIVSTQVALQASGLGASAAALATAWLVFMLPHSIVAVSVTTVYFTRMSTHATAGETGLLREDFGSAVKIVGLFNVLATAGLMVLAFPFSRVITGDMVQVQEFGEVVIAFMPGLVAFGLLYIVQRTFFSLEDTRTPFLLTAGYVVLYSAGVLACLALPVRYIAVGIAVVTSITGTIHAIVAAGVLRRRIGSLGLRSVVVSHLRYLGAVIPAVAVGLGLMWLLGAFGPDGFATAGLGPALLTMALVGGAMTLAYLAGLVLVRSPEFRAFTAPLRARFSRGG